MDFPRLSSLLMGLDAGLAGQGSGPDGDELGPALRRIGAENLDVPDRASDIDIERSHSPRGTVQERRLGVLEQKRDPPSLIAGAAAIDEVASFLLCFRFAQVAVRSKAGRPDGRTIRSRRRCDSRAVHSRRRILQLLATAAACEATGTPEPGEERSGLVQNDLDDAPDIIFISIDDLNDWPTPFTGDKPTLPSHPVHTPNIQRLADQGTVFQRAYCAAPMCGPSRSATMSGIPPHASGVTQAENIYAPKEDDFGPLLETPSSSLPRQLREAGYRTLGAGKIFHDFPKTTHDGIAGGPLEQDGYDANAWDDYLPVNNEPKEEHCPPRPNPPSESPIHDFAKPCYEPFDFPTSPLPDAAVGRYGCEQISARSDPSTPFFSAPMFLSLGFFKPHLAWQAPPEFFEAQYPLDAIKKLDPEEEKADQDDLTLTGCVTIRDSRNSPDSPQWQEDWDTSTRRAIQAYLACVTYVDQILGHVLDAIENTEKPRSTVIILWSDHGYFMGEKRGWKKPSLYERTTRVPLIIADTNTPVAQSTTKLASLMDVFPTVLDYAGCGSPAKSGRSLRPLVANSDASWDRTSVVSTFNFQSDMTRKDGSLGNADLQRCIQEHWPCSPTQRTCLAGPRKSHPTRFAGASSALRRQQYRYIRYFDSVTYNSQLIPVPTEELYDLKADPRERNNLLAGRPSAQILQLANEMREELIEKLT